MKVTLNWLKKYVHFDWTADELAERLTMLGLEVEGIDKLGGEFEGIVVAEVITRDAHPNADKLSLCRVHDGQGERQIVCGAQNFKAGDKVPLILAGASLPAKAGEKPFTIKVGKIRGVESHGMMCSPQELGLAEEADGLLILRQDAQVGQPFAQYLGRADDDDVVFDLEITPNRPDLNSVIGIAREIAAVTENHLRIPEINLPPETGESAADLVSVRIDDPDLCPRYTARLVRGVKVGPSPDWLRSALEKVGIRSINNVVDATNYVMMEVGQPLHAFDYHLVAKGADGKPTVVIRRARDQEKFTTLDEQEHTLSREILLIADEQKGIALAGVMGGQNTVINDQTVDVLIESAYFNSSNIRRASKTLGLRTDASYRFERGADIGISDWASQRCAQLILETADGQLAGGVVDAFPQPPEPREIALRHPQTNALLGIEIPEDIQIELLHRLGLDVLTVPGIAPNTGVRSPHVTLFRIPTFRVDLKRETDLIEEVERLYGLEKVPATPPRGAIGSHPFDTTHDLIAEARRALAALGLDEAQGQTLISSEASALWSDQPPMMLANPLSSDMNSLRSSLLPGLLDTLRHNLNHKQYDVSLFELGRVFSRKENRVQEKRHLALALTGQRQPHFWSGQDREAKVDIFDLKGRLEEFFEHFGIRGIRFAKAENPVPGFVVSASIELGKLKLGALGQLTPVIAKQYDLRDAVFLAELNFDLLLGRRNTSRSFKPLPVFPAIRRDVAMFLPESATHAAILEVTRKAEPANLESVELFDVFRGKNVPEGQKSAAYAFTYRHAERTLTDAEVNTAHEGLVTELRQSLQAVVREA